MKVEIWSDIACPFCYIGKRRFEEALRQFESGHEVEVVYRSFELDPHAPRDVGMDIYDMLAQKYGISREQAKAMNQNVAKMAKSAGLRFQFDNVVLTNTFDAHRLTHYAAQHGKMAEMKERLLQAYFEEGRHVGDRETLALLAAEVGLDRTGAQEVLGSDAYGDEVRRDEAEARQLGIHGVPFFVINRKYGISGAQSVEVFLEALQKAWSEQPKLKIVSGEDAAACTDESCTGPPAGNPPASGR